MRKVIVISTTNNPDSYSNRLAQHFIEGAKTAGIEVETISLGGKTMEEAFETGKRLFSPVAQEISVVPQQTVKTDVRVQRMVLVLGGKILPRKQIIADLGLQQRSRPCFINNYLKPTLNQGYIEFAYPNTPHKPEQAYKLTDKGMELYRLLSKEAE